ncbi:hypothetical protein BTA31_00130 [Bacillus haynesii]|uniref:Transposase n=1 Tax=Bacillus haynesii TaxID=1925021 RepID=A0ABX3IAJ9_9BACI|nr:hypothetical protein BTA31_00130 [Bacillus haynesii]
MLTRLLRPFDAVQQALRHRFLKYLYNILVCINFMRMPNFDDIQKDAANKADVSFLFFRHVFI